MGRTSEVAEKLIAEYEEQKLFDHADGVRVARNQLNDNGYDEGINTERTHIFATLILKAEKNGDWIKAEAMQVFYERLLQPPQGEIVPSPDPSG